MSQPSPREFASQYAATTPANRGKIIGSYRDWIVYGARAQGPWRWSVVVLGVSAFGLGEGWLVAGARSVALLAVGSLGLICGLGGTCLALRRERAWRIANPWRGPGSAN
jgi:hypothetical protein